MQFSKFIAALMAPIALAAPVRQSVNSAALVKRAAGNATIHNHCNFDVQVNPCAEGEDDGVVTIPAGKNWTQAQKNYGGAGKGVSLKVNKVDGTADNVAQFEYTVNEEMALVFYDLSLINGNPFLEFPQLLAAGESDPAVACPAGQSPCQAAYFWADQIATKAAAQGTDLDFHICSIPQSVNE